MDIDNEVIAGSEDEDEMPFDQGHGFRAAETSHISAFTNSASKEHMPDQLSSISNFTDERSRRTGAAILDPIESSFANTADDFFPVASIADRAKTRQRKSAATRPVETIIDITSDEDDFIPRNTAPKTKPKPKPKPKDKAPGGESSSIPPVSVPPTHESTPKSDQVGAPKARPRPRPLFKKPQDMPPPVSPSLSTFTRLGPDVPIATSPPRPSSQLIPPDFPPSDPPQSTFAPPAFPSGGSRRGDRGDSPLFSDTEDYPPPGNKPSPYEKSVARPPYTSNTPPRHPSPPLTFFASSSAPPPREDEPDIVDLTDIPDTQPIKIVIKKPTKTKRKLTDISVQDEEDADDDFDPSASTKKSKSKEKVKKPKAPKGKNKQPAGAPQVEVVITAKPSKKKAPAKGKGKQKDVADDSFKSREFVEDSDDEDPIGLRPSKTNPPPLDPLSPQAPVDRPPVSTSQPSPRTSSRTDRLKDVTETPDPAPTSHKPKARPNKRKSIVDSDADEDEEERRRTQGRENAAKKKRTTKDHGKGGGEDPSVNESRDDDEMPPREDDGSRASGSTKRSRGKVIQSDGDEDGDEDLEPNGHTPVRKAKGVSKKARTIPDTDDEMEVDKDEGNSKRKDDVHETAKENLRPSVKSTPGPSGMPTKADDTKSQGPHTPLYMRYEVAPRRSSLPMSELIRRATNTPSTPAPAGARGRVMSTPSQSATPKLTPTPRIYSPYLKASRSTLSRIAPLHPNRRTPPPPPPPPPPKKKTKKELEMEEQWEEELIESVGGITEWTSLSDAEKKDLRRIKWAKEMGNWSD